MGRALLNEDSVLKLTSDVNMEVESLIMQRVIYDAMSSVNATDGSFPITREIGRLQESRSVMEAT